MSDLLARLAAERDCARLVALYAAGADARDGTMADLFTADGVLETPAGSASGRDGIRAMAAEAPDRATLHLCGNVVIDLLDGDRAVGRSDCAFIAERIDRETGRRTLSVAVIGSYADDFRIEDGRWLFARRVFTAR